MGSLETDLVARCDHLLGAYGAKAVLMLNDTDARAAGLVPLSVDRETLHVPGKVVFHKIPAQAARAKLLTV